MKLYRLYSEQQAEDDWKSQNDYGIYSEFAKAKAVIIDLLDEERDSYDITDRRIEIDEDGKSVSVENGKYRWQTYYIKEYVLDMFRDDHFVEDPPRTPKW